MTTAAERIAEITARAAARGLTAPRTTQAAIRWDRPAQQTHSKPAANPHDARTATEKAVDASLTRPLPVSWHGKHRDAVDACRRIETRTAARLVAKALGDGWRTVIDDEMRWSTLRLAHPSGPQLNFPCPGVIPGTQSPRSTAYAVTISTQSPLPRTVRRSRLLAISGGESSTVARLALTPNTSPTGKRTVTNARRTGC